MSGAPPNNNRSNYKLRRKPPNYNPAPAQTPTNNAEQHRAGPNLNANTDFPPLGTTSGQVAATASSITTVCIMPYITG